MNSEEMQVLEAYRRMQQAMIDKDLETMRSLVKEDKLFVHMSKVSQTRKEFFADIMNSALNYYNYEIRNPSVSVNGNRAGLKADVTLDARAYGARGKWTLHTDTDFIKTDGKWVQCNKQ